MIDINFWKEGIRTCIHYIHIVHTYAYAYTYKYIYIHKYIHTFVCTYARTYRYYINAGIQNIVTSKAID